MVTVTSCENGLQVWLAGLLIVAPLAQLYGLAYREVQ